MNFLLPLLVGGPDMAEKILVATLYYISIIGVPNKSNTTEKDVSSFYNENLENLNLNSYLAGLFFTSVLDMWLRVKTLALIFLGVTSVLFCFLSLFIMIKLYLIQAYTTYSFCYFNYCNDTLVLLSSVPVLHKKSRKGVVKKKSTCTDLVVWGENLVSHVGCGSFTKLQAAMIVLAPLQLSVVVGLILSDCWLYYASPHSKNAGLGFEQSYAKYEYFWFVFNILSHYCSSWPVLKSRARQGKGKTLHALHMQTRALPCFTELHSLFYKNKEKIIPNNIYDLLTPIALAHWVMGDGQVASNGLRLCTDSYSFPEIVKLMNVLMIKYRINCTINFIGGKPRIYISAKSLNLLASIIKAYMTKSMYYKLESSRAGSLVMESNRNNLHTKSNIKAESRRGFCNAVKGQHRSWSMAGQIQPTLPTVCSKGVKYSNKNLRDNYLKRVIAPYLAGLFEGKGHIWFPKSNMKKKHNPIFCITFDLKNEPLAKKLLEVLESGHIRYKLKENACVLIVSPVKGLKKIIQLINGELRTPAGWCRKSPVWEKLSNSGDSLKLLIPNCIWNAARWWTNYSSKVTSQKMIEKEMGYRGSKSVVKLERRETAVKEQRVDGSWCVKSIHLRCTLTGFERNYQVKILSKQIIGVIILLLLLLFSLTPPGGV